MLVLTCYIYPQALDALVLKCPAEITPFLGNIIHAGTHAIKYDPVCPLIISAATRFKRLSQNYAGDGDDEDEEMADEEDEEDAELDE